MSPYHRAIRTAALVLAATLSACGGGGGGGMSDPTPAPETSYDLQAGVTALVHSGLSVDVTLGGSVIVDGLATSFTGTGVFTLSPGVRGAFNGASALLQTESITGTVTVGTQSSPYDFSVVNAYTAGAAFLGQKQADEIDVAQSPIVFPTTPAFASTPLATLTRYTDETLSIVLGTTDVAVTTLATATTSFVATDEQMIEFVYKTYDSNHVLVQTDTVTFGLSKENTLKFYAAASQSATGTLSVSIPFK